MSEAQEAPRPSKENARRKGWRGFWRNRKGVTAVEFALVSIPFFWLMCGLAENGLIFITQSNLDYAMMETQRDIRTGQVQVGGMTKTDLKNLVCAKMNAIGTVNCDLNLYLDVRSFPDFSTLTAPAVTTGNAVDPAKLNWSPGQPSEVVLVRGYYVWKLMTPVLSSPFANLGSNARLLQSTALFVNEPYAVPATGS